MAKVGIITTMDAICIHLYAEPPSWVNTVILIHIVYNVLHIPYISTTHQSTAK